MVYVFPVIFTPYETGYAIRFPDLPGAPTGCTVKVKIWLNYLHDPLCCMIILRKTSTRYLRKTSTRYRAIARRRP